jgi:hypothetical protein
MNYGGPYIKFESRFTRVVYQLWDSETDPELQEMLRLEILRQRIFARDYWERIGKEVPPRYKFNEE